MLPLRRAGVGQMETDNGVVDRAALCSRRWADASTRSSSCASERRARQHAGVRRRCSDQIFVMGDNRDDFGRQPALAGRRRRRLRAGREPRSAASMRSSARWDPVVRHDPVWTWPAGLRFSRFFSRVNSRLQPSSRPSAERGCEPGSTCSHPPSTGIDRSRTSRCRASAETGRVRGRTRCTFSSPARPAWSAAS